jgi:hypothetical protein
MKDDTIICPMINDLIEIADCVVYSDVTSGMLKDYCIPDKFKEKNNWRDICHRCNYHNM